MSQDNTCQAHVAEISTQETETFIRLVVHCSGEKPYSGYEGIAVLYVQLVWLSKVGTVPESC